MSIDKTIPEVLKFFFSDLSSQCSILVAVSGGADSIALLHLLHDLKDTLQISQVSAAHVNHALRGDESDADEEFVKKNCEKLQVQCFSTRLDRSGLKNTGIEEWARRERYRFFQQLKQAHHFDYIATAHTANDQAETLLMRMVRGAGVRGMRGILPWRQDGVIRPFLYINREQILEWLESNNITYRTDSSNFDTCYQRNWIRQEILPTLVSREPNAVSNIAGLAEKMGRIWNLLSENINIWIGSHVIRLGAQSFSVLKAGMLDDRIASEALVTLFDQYGIAVMQKHLQKIFSARLDSHGEFLLPGGWRFYPCKDKILFTSASRVERFSCTLPRDGEVFCAGAVVSSKEIRGAPEEMFSDNNTVCLDVSEQELPLEYRNARRDDRFWPLGAGGETDLTTFLKKQGFNRKERELLGVVVSASGNVLWVPGVRISQLGKIRPETQKHFIISFRHDLPGNQTEPG